MMKNKVRITKAQIVEWISKHFEYKFASDGNQIRICNPFDKDDNYKLWISLQCVASRKHPEIKNYWAHDFRGHFDGSFIRFVMLYKKCSYWAAIRQIVGSHALSYEKEEVIEDEEPIIQVELPSLSRPLFDETDESLAKLTATNYLYRRAITDDMIIDYRLQYTPTTIVFPYYEHDEFVFWQERAILNKIFNFPDAQKTGLRKTDYLYGFDKVEPNDDVIIVESIFNSLSVGGNCCATGGATISGRQPDKLELLSPRVIILAPDNDEAGRKSLRDNYFLLRHKFRLAYCLPPSNDDWNDIDRKLGIGSARKYVENNTRFLTVGVANAMVI